MYEILFSNQFKRSYKKCLKRGYDKACGNVIFSPIGCLFGNSVIQN